MLKSDHRELRNSKVKFKWGGGGVGGMRGLAETRLDLVNYLDRIYRISIYMLQDKIRGET